MKLNIGSSGKLDNKFKQKDWVNIDLYAPEIKRAHKYVVCDATKLPFKDESFDEIYSIHMLEHVPRKLHNLFYQETYRVLRKNCHMFVEVPDLIQVCTNLVQVYKNSPNNLELLRIWTLSLYGKARHAGDSHQWGFTPEQLVKDLSSFGFKAMLWNTPVSNHYKQEPVILVRAIKI